MKGTILFLCVVFYPIFNLKSQDVVNNYIDWTGINHDDYARPYGIYDGGYFRRLYGYEGEFLITAEQLPWADPNRFLGNLAAIDINNLIMTFDIELVSFPFSMDCAFEPGCNDGGSLRILDVPSDGLYNPLYNRWDYSVSLPTNASGLYNKIQSKVFERQYGPAGELLFAMNDQSIPLVLSSVGFVRPGFDISRLVIPHSVLKITISVHCGQFATDPVLDQFNLYVDLTRGMMRRYPFTVSNSSVSPSPSQYDVTIRPVICQPLSSASSYTDAPFCEYSIYDPSSTCDSYSSIKGDVCNMHPFVPADDDFCQILYNAYADVRSVNDIFEYNPGPGSRYVEHLSIPDRSIIVSTGIRDASGKAPSGFENVGGVLQAQNAPIVHQYTVNRNIDLTKINPSEMVIYNPSEVSISANNLTFPSGYTFKTISGTYPFLPDLLQQSADPLNGGPYNTTDPYSPNYISKLPNQTDLFVDFNSTGSYPTQDHRYSSIYHIESNAKVTIEPCVSLYDMVFDVKPNSELYFQNWTTNQKNINRYKIDFNGGKVRKGAPQWKFQNNTVADRILAWDSESFILAGRYVDPGSTHGNYVLESGSQTLFKANDYIELEHGFEAKEGSEFYASIDNVNLGICAPAPPQRLKGPDSRTPLGQKDATSVEITPNPAVGNAYLILDLKEKAMVAVKIFDNLGHLLWTEGSSVPLMAGKYQYKMDLSSFLPGVYYISVFCGEELFSRKVVKID